MRNTNDTTRLPRTKAELQKRVTELEAALHEKERIDADYQSVEDTYRSLFKNMLSGLAYCRMLFENGIPDDFIFLNVNDAFETQTGLKDVVGKKATEITPGIKESDSKLFDIVGRVALSGQQEQFELYIEALQMWFSVSAYSPKKEHFVAVFNVITEQKKAEQALREGLEHASRLANLLDHSSQPFAQAFPDGRVGMFNQAVLDLTGYTREEFSKIDWVRDLTPPEWIPLEIEKLEILNTTGEPVRYQKEYIRKDGSRVPVELLVHLIKDNDGNPKYYYAFVTDITSRRHTEKELQVAYTKYKTLFHSFPFGITVADKSGQILESNRMAEKLLGLSPEEFKQRKIDGREWQIIRMDGTLMPPEEFASVRALKENRLIENVEMGIVKPSGEVMWVSVAAIPIPLDEGGVVITYADITERKQTQDELRLSEERLHLALNAANAGTWEWDLRTNESIWSEELWGLYRLRPHSLNPSYDAWLETVHPDDRYKAEEAVKDAVRRGTKLNVEWRMFDPDGKERWLMLRGKPLHDIAGRVVRFIGISIDITERKRTEAALHESEEKLRLFIEHAPSPLAMFDREMRYISASRRWLSDYGLAEPVIGQSHYEIFPDIPEHWKEAHRRGLSGEIIRNDEDHFERQNGSVQWLRWEIRPWHIASGEVGGIIIFAENITERKLSEQALQESRHKFQVVADHTYDFESWLDPHGNFIYASPSCERIYGYGPTEFTSDPSLRQHVVHPEDRCWFDEHLQAVEAAHTHGEVEFRIVRKDGSIRWIEHACQPIFDEQGCYLGVRGSNRDVTDRKQAEEALQKSERNYREIFNATSEAIFLHDAETGCVLDVNDTMLRMFGYETKEEVIGKNVGNFSMSLNEAPFTREEAARRILLAVKQGNQVFEWHARKKNGDLFWVEVSLRSTQIGGEGRVLAAVRNITDRKLTEQTLQESERNYREIFNATSEAIAIHDATTGQMLDVNDTMVSMHGYDSKAEILTDTFENSELLKNEPPYTTEEALRRIHVAVEHGPQVFEWFARKKNGKRFWVEVSLRSTQIGGAGRVLVTLRDITERKRAEDELRKSEEQFRTLVEGAPYAIFVQTDRRISYLNTAACRLFGADSPDELLGEPVIDRIHADMQDLVQKRMYLLNEKRRAVSIREQIMLRLDGTHIYVEASAVPFVYEGKNGALVFLQDITKRKHAEEEKEKLQAQLLQAQKLESVGRLAGGVAHEFNNMLHVIIGYAEMSLYKADRSLPMYDNLNEILKAANRSAEITRKLLAFARKQTFLPKVIDLNEAIESMLKTLRRLIGEDIELVWLPAKELYPVKIDPLQVDQILTNLIINARDAISGVGIITVSTGNATLDESYCAGRIGFFPGEFALLTISDTGCGIDKGTMEHIFEPFFSTKEIGHGTGMGLPMVYGMIKQNHGLITVDSEPGTGTTVRIYLPLHEGETVKRKAESAKIIPVGQGETVLLVEDEPDVLNLGRRILEQYGYTVLTALTSETAFALAAAYFSARSPFIP
ncbi:MAG: PAS domain S-box protein [Chlorobiales bacterium]|nr:PAS domain S-box protein [Chlorobiales bacterium]